MALRALLALHPSARTADRTAQLGARFSIATATLNSTLARAYVSNKFCSFTVGSLGQYIYYLSLGASIVLAINLAGGSVALAPIGGSAC
jgi:hypothetical protein